MGNQILDAGAATLALDSFEPPVSRSVRLEGAGFYLHGRVAIVAREPRRIRAVVRGSRPYDVTVIGGGSEKVAVGCDCVAFRDQPAVCRHVWAVLIKTQNESLLPPPAMTTAVP